MKKILNWTIGSFFRTIGRTIAFLLFGALLFYICQKSGLKITDLLGIGRVYADTTYSFSTKQSKIYYDNQGTEASYNWQNVPYTHSANYPITKMEYRLSYSQGLSAGNIYTFTLYFTPTPDSINVSGLSFHDLTGDITNVNCSGWSRNSNGRYQNTCAVGLDRDISSSNYLYGMITFNAGYLDTLRSDISSFSITKGTGAVIQDSAIDIMNNNNNNTNNIINNQNELLGNLCSNLFDKSAITTGYTFLQAGGTTPLTNAFIGNNFIKVEPGSRISIGTTTNYTSETDYRLQVLEYTSTKTFITRRMDTTQKSTYFTLSNNTHYIKIGASTITKDELMVNIGSLKTYCEYGSYISKLDDTTNSINNLNDSINDSDVSGATTQASNMFTNFTTDNHGLTAVVQAPLNFIQSLSSSTCSVLHIPIPFLNNKYLDLPCLLPIYQEFFGNFLIVYQIILSGIIGYQIAVSVFYLVKDFKDPDSDKIEVLDL